MLKDRKSSHNFQEWVPPSFFHCSGSAYCRQRWEGPTPVCVYVVCMGTVESWPEPPEASTESAAETQVKAIHMCDQKGWSLAAPLLGPI